MDSKQGYTYLHRSRAQRDDLGIGERKVLGSRQTILELLKFWRDVFHSKSLHILPAWSPFSAFEENAVTEGSRAVDPKNLWDQRKIGMFRFSGQRVLDITPKF